MLAPPIVCVGTSSRPHRFRRSSARIHPRAILHYSSLIACLSVATIGERTYVFMKDWTANLDSRYELQSRSCWTIFWKTERKCKYGKILHVWQSVYDMSISYDAAKALSPRAKHHFPNTNHTCAFCRAQFLENDEFNKHVEAHIKERGARRNLCEVLPALVVDADRPSLR